MTMPPEFEGGSQPYPASGPARSDGLAIAALVVGIISLFTSLCNLFGLPFSIAAIVLGILGIRRGGGGKATAGLILGIISFVLALIVFAVGVWFMQSGFLEEFQQEQQARLQEIQQQQQQFQLPPVEQELEVQVPREFVPEEQPLVPEDPE